MFGTLEFRISGGTFPARPPVSPFSPRERFALSALPMPVLGICVSLLPLPAAK
jgi:hypothetical protein